MPKYETREAWLNAGVDALRSHFADVGFPVPTVVRVSVGFPRAKRKAVGQCWKRSAAKDGVSQIFITPSEADAVEVLDTLAHELVHAAIDPFSGHNGKFVKACKAVGLTSGKPTSAAAGDELRSELVKMASSLGEYPHAALSPSDGPKQTTRLLKVSCRECGYVARVTAKWLDDAGAPLCPCNSTPMRIAKGKRK